MISRPTTLKKEALRASGDLRCQRRAEAENALGDLNRALVKVRKLQEDAAALDAAIVKALDRMKTNSLQHTT